MADRALGPQSPERFSKHARPTPQLQDAAALSVSEKDTEFLNSRTLIPEVPEQALAFAHGPRLDESQTGGLLPPASTSLPAIGSARILGADLFIPVANVASSPSAPTAEGVTSPSATTADGFTEGARSGNAPLAQLNQFDVPFAPFCASVLPACDTDRGISSRSVPLQTMPQAFDAPSTYWLEQAANSVHGLSCSVSHSDFPLRESYTHVDAREPYSVVDGLGLAGGG